jgi:DNA-binding NtrC family response regulator
MNDAPKGKGGEHGPSIQLRQVKLTVVRGKDRGREWVLASDVIRVGKAPENDLVLDEETVSRVHFEIVRDGKGWLLRDLKSTNGTFLEGAEIKEGYLRPGSMISAGAAQMKFHPFEEKIEIPPFEADNLGEMVGRSPRMHELFGLMARIAPTDVSALIEGEAGTGKELCARTIHVLSRRKAGPFVIVDCRRASSAVESELFGSEKATQGPAPRQGAFERAAGGTLLLHEPGELSVDLQPKLLRVLESRELRRFGGAKPTKVDVRMISTGTRPLAAEIDRGKFREDLYTRLAAVTLHLPPLRERGGDVLLLAQHLLGSHPERSIDQSEGSWLAAHDWPGNVDELRTVVLRTRRAGTLGTPAGAAGSRGGPDRTQEEFLTFDADLPFREQKERWSDEFEKRYLIWLIARSEGNISKAARDADMDRKYLHKLLKKHGIVTVAD